MCNTLLQGAPMLPSAQPGLPPPPMHPSARIPPGPPGEPFYRQQPPPPPGGPMYHGPPPPRQHGWGGAVMMRPSSENSPPQMAGTINPLDRTQVIL